MQMQKMEYEEAPEGPGTGEWNSRQEGGVDLWLTERRGAVLQSQHREDLGAGWWAETAVQLQSAQTVWMEPGWTGRYRVAAGAQRGLRWHMTWLADQRDGAPVTKEWGGELQGGKKNTDTVGAHFTGASLAPPPTTQGHRGQEAVYTGWEEMTLKAAETIKVKLNEGATRLSDRTYHAHPHKGDMWHDAFPGNDGMEGTSPLPGCVPEGNNISALSKVAEEWVREAGGVDPGGVTGTDWTVGAIRRARYRTGEWMTQEDTKLMFPMAPKGPAATQWRRQAVHMLFHDDRLGDGGTLVVEVRHGQGARYNVRVPNVVVTMAAAESMEVRIGREGYTVQVCTMRHWDGQLEIHWKSAPA